MSTPRIRRSTRTRKLNAGSKCAGAERDFHNDFQRALAAEEIVQGAKKENQLLSRDALADCTASFAQMARTAYAQGNVVEFKKWAVLTVDAAKKLLPYQSQKIAPIDFVPATDDLKE